MRGAVIAAIGAALAALLLWVMERPRARFVMTTWPNHTGVSRANH